jgi:hypothetical protein
MQIDYSVPTIAVTATGIEVPNQKYDPETDNKQAVAANENETRWPLVPFPDGWYASF